MSFKDQLAKAKNIKEEIAKLQQQAQEKGNQLFKDAVKALFDENPHLESFSWNQYTPYFNDGDTCYFSVNEYSIQVNGITEDDVYDLKKVTENTPESIAKIKQEITKLEAEIKKLPTEEFKDWNSKGSQLRQKVENLKYDLPDESTDKEQALKQVQLYDQVQELINAFDEDTMLALFGDHAEITVTKDDIQIERYDHD